MITIGAIDGNIIALIITTQTPRNQPSFAEVGFRSGVHPGHPIVGQDPAECGEQEQSEDQADLDQPGQVAAGGGLLRIPRRPRL